MKITFSWKNISGTAAPFCEAGDLNSDGVSNLCCLLMDDGGIPIVDTISWLSEGIHNADLVISGKLKSANWDRESWGVEMGDGIGKIHSLIDEDYVEEIDLQQLRNAIEYWLRFVQTKPDTNYIKIYDLE